MATKHYYKLILDGYEGTEEKFFCIEFENEVSEEKLEKIKESVLEQYKYRLIHCYEIDIKQYFISSEFADAEKEPALLII